MEKKGIDLSSYLESLYTQPTQEDLEKQKRSFDAMLAYERNCRRLYDYPSWMCKPSRPQRQGDTMADFSARYGTTVAEMKAQEQAVEKSLELNH